MSLNCHWNREGGKEGGMGLVNSWEERKGGGGGGGGIFFVRFILF